MIYNWSKFELQFHSITAKEAARAAPDGWKSQGSREYFVVDATNAQLVDESGVYAHPNPGDIFVVGDSTYGLDHIIKSTRQGACWNFKLLIHKLIKSTFAPPKTFGATHKTA